MNRRNFLALGIGVTAVPLFSACRSDSKWLQVISQPGTIARFCDEKELLEIGSSYLQMFPHERKSSTLQTLILDDLETSSRNTLVNSLEQKKSGEFRNAESVIVAGWVLSRTEARQCALYTLKRNSS